MPEPASPSPRICPSCGLSGKPTSKFCRGCGKPLPKHSPPEAAPPAQSAEPVPRGSAGPESPLGSAVPSPGAPAAPSERELRAWQLALTEREKRIEIQERDLSTRRTFAEQEETKGRERQRDLDRRESELRSGLQNLEGLKSRLEAREKEIGTQEGDLRERTKKLGEQGSQMEARGAKLQVDEQRVQEGLANLTQQEEEWKWRWKDLDRREHSVKRMEASQLLGSPSEPSAGPGTPPRSVPSAGEPSQKSDSRRGSSVSSPGGLPGICPNCGKASPGPKRFCIHCGSRVGP